MNNILKNLGTGATLAFLAISCNPPKIKSPNVLIILADDLGFSDLGCYGGEIKTPNLDNLSSNGLRFTQFYNCGRSWPTRASLLTGYYPQEIGRDSAPGISGGGRGIRPEWARLLPDLLKRAGYRSYHSGKWHIDGMPVKSGFDRSYYLQDQGRFFNPETHYEDDVKLPAVPPGTGYYSTIEIADRTIAHLKEHKLKYPDKPFFSYVAFTAPHFPLHALPEDIKKVGTRYASGWGVWREKRWKRIQELGIISNADLSEVEPHVGPPYHFPEAYEILGKGEVNRPLPWDSLGTEQKKFQQEKMAIHAAMIERMDIETGKIINQLREMGEIDNTLIIFLSDNGASAEIMVRDDGHDVNASPGSASSYLCLGPGWSNMSNTPFRRLKTWVHEGGICTPFIVQWLDGIEARGELRHTHGHVIDIVPTILDLAGLQGTFTGQSLKPAFRNDITREHPLWWFHEGNRAYREGGWKIVAAAKEEWELFNLNTDRTESHNLAESNPGLLSEMEEKWNAILNDIRDKVLLEADTAKSK